jgi:DNA polymerase III sliding clamp (beta) subunit (PCNA family)
MLIVDIENAKNLRTPLSRVAAAINRNTPIETCVLLEATSEGLTLTSVDSRTHQLTMRVPGAITAQIGQAILNADLFNRMVGTLQEESVQIGINEIDNQLIIQADTRIELDLFTSPPDDFPVENTLPPVVATLDAERLSEAIKKALLLSEKDDYIVFKGVGDALYIYTKAKGRLFSRTTLQVFDNVEDWVVMVPTHLLAKLSPTISGAAELRLDNDKNLFAISVGVEHLLIRQLSKDKFSGIVDDLVQLQTSNYWVIKSEPLKSDLKRAGLINDKRGLRLVKDKNNLRTTCGVGGKGKVDTPHTLVQVHGSLDEMFLDPVLLAKAVGALEAVDLVGEQIKVVTESFLEDDDTQEEKTHIRLTDMDAQDYRAVIVTSLS